MDLYPLPTLKAQVLMVILKYMIGVYDRPIMMMAFVVSLVNTLYSIIKCMSTNVNLIVSY